MDNLTPRQRQILDFIKGWMQEQGMPPTRAEIARAFGFRSANAAEDHLRALARNGAIELMEGASRGIRLAEPSGLPIVGRVAAGAPLLAQQHIEDHLQIDPSYFHPRADYLLRVHGQSMRDCGILHGDLLAVKRAPTASTDQIVVARLEDEVTVKRFRQRGNIVTLLPENPDFEPIRVDLRHDNFSLEGIAVGLLRTGI